MALSEWALINQQYFNKQRILELGSGVGLSSLVIAKECLPDCLYLTDCHGLVLNLLCENVKLNITEPNLKDNFDIENRYHILFFAD